MDDITNFNTEFEDGFDHEEHDWIAAQELLNSLVSGGEIDETEKRAFMSRVAFAGTTLGLSMSHIFVNQRKMNPAQATFWLGAGLIQCQGQKIRKEDGRKGGGVRGKVNSFSKQSRLRLMKLVAALRQDELPIFITLTYPAEWPADPLEWKRHLKNFLERMNRKFSGRLAILWKLEPQQRGAPHYHMFVYGLNAYYQTLGWKEMLKWVSQNWYEVVGSGDELHHRAGTRVEKLRSKRGAMFYASKYLTKEDEGIWADLDVGRYWGVFFRDNLPLGEAKVIPLTKEEAKIVVRYIRKKLKMKGRAIQSISMFFGADFWYERLPDILYPAMRTSGLRDFMNRGATA